MTDNLQTIVDDLRTHLGTGAGVCTTIRVDGLLLPLELDVIPDGLTWIACLKCGERVLFDEAVDPKAFVSNLYVFLRYAINEASGRGPKRVGAN